MSNYLRVGRLQNQIGVNVFASDNLTESNNKLYYSSQEVLTEDSSIIIKIVSSLPTASSSYSGRYFLLNSENKIYKCSNIDSSWVWVEIKFVVDLTFSSPLIKDSSTGVVSISGIDTASGSEEKFLTEKGTFKQGVSLEIDSTTKNWIIGGVDSGVSAQGTAGPAGTIFTPSVSSAGVISWKNNGGLSNPDPVNIKGQPGDRGTTLLIGEAITGTNQSGTIFALSGIASALVGDLYLNKNYWYLYKCVTAGAPAVAQWSYMGGIRGETGAAMSIGASGDLQGRSAYDNEAKDFIYLTNDGYAYRKLSNTSGDWSNAIQFKGDKGDIGAAFTYNDFTQEQLEGLRGPQGYTPSIDPETKRWKINDVDTGIVAEGTGRYSPGTAISIIGSTIAIAGASATTGSEEKFLNQKGQFAQVLVPAKIISYDAATGLASAQPIDPVTGQSIGDTVSNLIVDWKEINE